MLLNIPTDILVKLLHVLEVRDILLVESACRSLQQCIMHDVRHLWLTKLNELDPSCAPDMPHNTPVESLTCEELRSIVIKAVRQYWALVKSSPSKPIFYLKNRIPVNCPEMNFASRFRSGVIPGGRYLFIFWSSFSLNNLIWSQDFYIVDTNDSNRRVWSYEHENSHDLHAFDFKARRDGTIILVVLDRDTRTYAPVNGRGFFRVLELSLESEGGTFRETQIYSMQCSKPLHDDLCAQTRYPVSDDLVLLLDPGISLILALKLDDKKTVKIQCTRFSALRCFRIWHDHLFYFDTERQELRTVRLSQLFDEHANGDSLVELDHLSCATLSLHGLRDQNGNQPVPSSSQGIMYSIYDMPWKKDPTAVFTITLQTSIRHPHFTTIRARLSYSVNWEWTVLSVRTTADHHLTTCGTLMFPDMTRSGRFFFFVIAGIQKLEYGICAVDRQGDPVIAFQKPMEINQLLQGSDVKHGQSSTRLTETFVKTGLDEYSGSLAILGKTGSKEHTLHIYYPV